MGIQSHNQLVQVLAAFKSFHYFHHFVPIPERSLLPHFSYDILFYFIHVYVYRRQRETVVLMEAERFYTYIYIAPAGADNKFVPKFLCQQKASSICSFVASLKNILLNL